MVKVSIIVPIYNLEDYLHKCIESIVKQTLKQIEIILVDDGSTDSSLSICKDYARYNERIIVIHKENGGASEARNAGLKKAQGEYIGFVDGDDWIEKDMYKNLYLAAKEYSADIVGFDQSIERVREANLKNYFLTGNVSVSTKLFHNKLIKSYCFVEGETSEDVLASYELVKKAKKYVEIPGDYYHYIKRSGSVCHSEFKSSDLSAVKFTLKVAQDVKISMPECYDYAILHYYKAIFNVINKSVNYGFACSEDKRELLQNFEQYINILNSNLWRVIKSKYFSKYDKIQIFILCISPNLFKKIKKFYRRRIS